MKKIKELSYPKVLRGICWFAVIFFSVILFGSVLTIFIPQMQSAMNSTAEAAIGCSFGFLSFVILLIFLLIMCYHRKIIIYSDYIIIQYVFKKSIKLPFAEVSKCIFINTGYRGSAQISIYGNNAKKLITIDNDLSIVLDFIDCLEVNNIPVETKGGKK